jgi:lipid-binding SYLF domain-containing protein
MFMPLRALLALLVVVLPLASALADDYADTVKTFRDAGQSGEFFKKSYGYAVFPTIGKAGIGIGGAHGAGRVYAKGKHVGDSSMNQLSVGLQLGAQGFSQIIFFEDKAAFDRFTKGDFQFGAQASAVAITAGASAQASSAGAGAGASTSKLGGQKFSYKPKQ